MEPDHASSQEFCQPTESRPAHRSSKAARGRKKSRSKSTKRSSRSKQDRKKSQPSELQLALQRARARADAGATTWEASGLDLGRERPEQVQKFRGQWSALVAAPLLITAPRCPSLRGVVQKRFKLAIQGSLGKGGTPGRARSKSKNNGKLSELEVALRKVRPSSEEGSCQRQPRIDREGSRLDEQSQFSGQQAPAAAGPVPSALPARSAGGKVLRRTPRSKAAKSVSFARKTPRRRSPAEVATPRKQQRQTADVDPSAMTLGTERQSSGHHEPCLEPAPKKGPDNSPTTTGWSYIDAFLL